MEWRNRLTTCLRNQKFQTALNRWVHATAHDLQPDNGYSIANKNKQFPNMNFIAIASARYISHL